MGRTRRGRVTVLRILVVDDDPTIAGLLAETLESNGHLVCGIATTEEGAVTAAARERPDMIIVDVLLGRGSGIRAIELIQRSHPVPHVFMTGGTLPPGAEGLMKPFRETDLVAAMDRALATAVLRPPA